MMDRISAADSSQRAVGALWGSEFVSTLGTQMSGLAIAWAVLTTTGSPATMALVMAAEVAPVGLAVLAGGRIASRLGPRRVVLSCDAARIPVLAAITVILSRPDPPLLPLLALVAIAGFAISPYLTAQRLLLAEIGGEEPDAVRRSNAGLQVGTRAAVLIGPLAAGGLIPLVGAAAVIGIDAATYLSSFLLVSIFVPRDLGEATGHTEGSRTAWRYMRADLVIRGLIAASAGSELAFQSLSAAIPVMALSRYGGGATTAGALVACWGVGALAGNLLLAVVKRVADPLTTTAWAAAGAALGFVAVATLPPLPVLAGVLLAVGISAGVRGPLVLTYSILRVPVSQRPEMTTLYFSLILCSAPIALLVSGPAIQWLGVRALLTAAAGVAIACAVGFARLAVSERRTRGQDEPTPIPVRLQLRRP